VNIRSYDFWGTEANINATKKEGGLLHRVNIDKGDEDDSLEEIRKDITSFKEAEEILEKYVESDIINRSIPEQNIDTSSPGWSSKYIRDWKRRFQIKGTRKILH